MRLCPQAWPTPGRASYSAQITIDSGPDPARARTAVGKPVGAALDVEAARVERVGHALRRRATSSKQSSGSSWMARLSATRCAASPSMAWRTCRFADAVGARLRRARGSWCGQPRHSMTAMTSPGPTESPAATLTSVTVPAFSAVMAFSIFMASSTQTVWPTSTVVARRPPAP